MFYMLWLDIHNSCHKLKTVRFFHEVACLILDCPTLFDKEPLIVFYLQYTTKSNLEKAPLGHTLIIDFNLKQSSISIHGKHLQHPWTRKHLIFFWQMD